MYLVSILKKCLGIFPPIVKTNLEFFTVMIFEEIFNLLHVTSRKHWFNLVMIWHLRQVGWHVLSALSGNFLPEGM